MVIKEFLPNPVGNDKEGEYLKIFNDGGNAVLLDGWSIKNIAGKSYKLTGKISAGGELVLPYSQTKIPLNNNGETVFLYDEKSVLADKLGYAGGTGLKEGKIVTRNQKLVTSNQQAESFASRQITNYELPISNIIFLDFLVAVILAGFCLYIILQLEKKLEIKLF